MQANSTPENCSPRPGGCRRRTGRHPAAHRDGLWGTASPERRTSSRGGINSGGCPRGLAKPCRWLSWASPTAQTRCARLSLTRRQHGTDRAGIRIRPRMREGAALVRFDGVDAAEVLLRQPDARAVRTTRQDKTAAIRGENRVFRNESRLGFPQKRRDAGYLGIRNTHYAVRNPATRPATAAFEGEPGRRPRGCLVRSVAIPRSLGLHNAGCQGSRHSRRWVPAPYVFAAEPSGGRTTAVAPSGMVKSQIHMSPSYRHALATRPAADL